MFPIVCFIGAALLVALLDHASAIPWRRAPPAHWTERARLLWPARRGTMLNLLTVPAFVVLFQIFWWPVDRWMILLGILAAAFGALLGTWPLQREMQPALSFKAWSLENLVRAAVSSLRWIFFWWVAVSMPDPLDWSAAGLVAAFVAYDLWTALGGLLAPLRALGYLREAPERVRRLTGEVCAQLGMALPKTWIVANSTSNAFAFFWNRALGFTERLLAQLDDRQLKGVIAHELGHLAESRGTRTLRMMSLLGIWPWLLLRSLLNAFGPSALLGLAAWSLLVRRWGTALSRKLEVRADQVASQQEPGDEAVYAQALAIIHEDNLVPAVISGSVTHPNLYDRMLASGVTPAFPRPAPPARWNALSLLLAIACGVLFFLHLKEPIRAFKKRSQRAVPQAIESSR